MLFLNWYPGVDDPFLSSSLKITICSKRKTLRSLERDRTPASCSVTKKVSCCSSLPWLVSLPCGWNRSSVRFLKISQSAVSGQRRTSYPCSRPKFIMSLHSLGTWDIKSTAFCEKHSCAITRTFIWRTRAVLRTKSGFYLDLLTVHACLGAELQEVLRRTLNCFKDTARPVLITPRCRFIRPDLSQHRSPKSFV